MTHRKLLLFSILSALLILLLGAQVALVPLQAQGEPRVYEGRINDELPFEEIPFSVAENGSTVIVDVVPTSDDLDTLLYLVDSESNIVAENDDRTARDVSSRIEFPQADAGDYRIIVTRYGVIEGDSSGTYKLNLEVFVPDIEAEGRYAVSTEALLAAGFPEIDPRPEAEWTILAYYGGDTNLEPGLLNDFNEFELAGGSEDDVRIIMMMDRHPEFTVTDPDWYAPRIFEVGPNTTLDSADTYPPTIDSEPLVEFKNDIDTGDGQTLAQFLVWGVRNYPAKHYAVALASHGSGWRGVIQDDTAGHSIISIPELRWAFGFGTAAAGIDKFDLLINDACLMSSIEYHHAMSDFFDYSLASPEVVVNPALNMTLFVEALHEDPQAAVNDIGSKLVDRYMGEDILSRPSPDTLYLTSAVVDLSKMQAVVDAMEGFIDLIQDNTAAFSTLLGQARSNAYTYSAYMGGEDLIDLGDLMRQINLSSTDENVQATTNAVLEALNNAITYARAGDRVQGRTTYHNIYFPADSQDFQISYFNEGYLDDWGKMLRSYYNAVTPQIWVQRNTTVDFHPAIAPKVNVTSVYPIPETDAAGEEQPPEVSIVSPLSINLEITGRNIARGDSTIDRILEDGTVIRLLSDPILRPERRGGEVERINSWRSGIDILDIVWRVQLPVITNGESSSYELLSFTEDVASMDGRYRERGGDQWNDVSLVFDENGDLQRVINRDAETDAVGETEIPVGADFQTFRYLVTPDGRVTLVPGTLFTWNEAGLSFTWEPAETGLYRIGMLMTAFGGTTGFASQEVRVNNDGLDPALRADIRTNLGFSMVRSKDWSVLAPVRGAVSFFRTSNETNTSNYSVYWVLQNVENDLEKIASDVIDDYSLESDKVFTPLMVSGDVPAVQFDYTYEADNATIEGRAFAIYTIARIPIGLVFAAETSPGGEDLDTLYQQLVDNLLLFDVGSFESSDSRQWTFSPTLIENTTYPRLETWPAYQVDDVWFRHVPMGDESSPSFAAVAAIDLPVEDAEAALDSIIEEYVMDNATEFRSEGREVYSGENHSWDTETYTAVRVGKPVVGRVYVHLVNDLVYTLWVETLNLEEASGLFQNVFEPMLDGFIITEVAPEEAPDAPVSINAVSDNEDAILLRYDRRSLVIYNRLPTSAIDISVLQFVQTTSSGRTQTFSVSEFTEGDTRALQPSDCFQIWSVYFRNLDADDFPADICQSRRASFQTIRAFWLDTNPEPDATFEVRIGEKVLATCPVLPEITFEDYQAGDPEEVSAEVRCVVSLTG